MEKKTYKDYGLGFDRTQLYKEYIEPIDRRKNALWMSLKLMELYEQKWTMKQLIGFSQRLESYFETGNDKFVPRFDEFTGVQQDEIMEKLLNHVEDVTDKKNI